MAIRLLIWAPGLGNNLYERNKGRRSKSRPFCLHLQIQSPGEIEVAKVAESTHSLSLPRYRPDEFVSLQTHPISIAILNRPTYSSLLSIAGPEDCDAFFFFLLFLLTFPQPLFPLSTHSLLAPTPPATLRRLKRFRSSEPPEAFPSNLFFPSLFFFFFYDPSAYPVASFALPTCPRLQLRPLAARKAHHRTHFLPAHLLFWCQSKAGPNPLFSRY